MSGVSSGIVKALVKAACVMQATLQAGLATQIEAHASEHQQGSHNIDAFKSDFGDEIDWARPVEDFGS